MYLGRTTKSSFENKITSIENALNNGYLLDYRLNTVKQHGFRWHWVRFTQHLISIFKSCTHKEPWKDYSHSKAIKSFRTLVNSNSRHLSPEMDQRAQRIVAILDTYKCNKSWKDKEFRKTNFVPFKVGETKKLNKIEAFKHLIDDHGNSLLPRYPNYVFAVREEEGCDWRKKYTDRYYITCVPKADIDLPLDKPVILTEEKLQAMRIREDGTSIIPALSGYKYEIDKHKYLVRCADRSEKVAFKITKTNK